MQIIANMQAWRHAFSVCVVAFLTMAAPSPFVCALEPAAAGATEHATGEEAHRHAQTLFWFAIERRDAPEKIRLAKLWLDEAEKSLGKERVASLKKQIETLDLSMDNHFFGMFPWAPYLASSSVFRDPRAMPYIELHNNPEAVAGRGSIRNLIDALTASRQHTFFDLVLISGDENQVLQLETLPLFSKSEQFGTHSEAELDVLTSHERRRLRKLEMTPEMHSKLLRDFQFGELLLVQTKKIDEVAGHYFFAANSHVYGSAGNEGASQTDVIQPEMVLHNVGFSVDRRAMVTPLVVMNLLLLAVAIVGYRFLAQASSVAVTPPSWGKAVLWGGLGFVWGRTIVWPVAELMQTIIPPGQASPWVSSWWPAVAGVAILIGPAVLMRLALYRFNLSSWSIRSDALLVATALGSTTFVAQLPLIVRAWSGWTMVPPLIVSAVAVAYVLGCALDKTNALSAGWGLAAAVSALAIGPTFCQAAPVPLWGAAVATGALAFASFRKTTRTPTSGFKVAVRPAPADSDSPETLHDLNQPAAPPYHETKRCATVLDALRPWRDGKTVHLGLHGSVGVGKSAMLQSIDRKVCEEIPGAVVMRGVCPETQAGSAPQPYTPFIQAISEHFRINPLAPEQSQLERIDEALGGIFDSVVPFGALLFPPARPDESRSKNEIFASVAAMLRRLARKQPVILMIDDVQWMDPASRELGEHLLEEFTPQDDLPLAVLLAGREKMRLPEGGDLLEVPSPSEPDVRAMLEEGLGFEPSATADLLNAFKGCDNNLHWLFQILGHVTKQGFVVRQAGRFTWSDPNFRLSEQIPDNFREALHSELDAHPEYRNPIICAACVGAEFSVERLSKGLGVSRLELLCRLDRIEKETGVVHDIRHKEDYFAFRSPFMLEMLRKTFEITAAGPHESAAPQLVREFHYRLAQAAEGLLDSSNTELYTAANHYFAAGARHADKAYELSLKAAAAASAQLQHDLARQYLEKASACAGICGAEPEGIERVRLLVECQAAHIAGQRRVATARAALDYLQQHPDADFEVYRVTARACYDAGVDTRDQLHFGHCVRVAREMLDRFDAPLQQAEAHQFVGISMPPNEVVQRRRHLETAFSLAEEAGQGVDALRLKSRIANSLAEQLSYGSPDDQADAERLFLLSIELKSRKDIRDVPGLAFAHGGLGRLAFFAEVPDYDAARRHFEADLAYSEKIDNRTGQAKMHSFLAACEVRQSKPRYDQALQHYDASYLLAEGQYDKFFALAGLIECYGALDRGDEANRFGEELVELVRANLQNKPESERSENPLSAIPPHCLPNIKAALRCSEACRETTWHRWLTELVTTNSLVLA